MERVTLDLVALCYGVDELQIEESVVADEYGTVAALRLDLPAHELEYLAQSFVLVHRQAQRMERVDTGHFQRGRIQPRARERLDVIADGLAQVQTAIVIEPQQDRGDLEQRIGCRVEPARLHVHDHREEAAKAVGDSRGRVEIRQFGH